MVYAVKRGRYLVFSRAYDENVIFLLLGSFRFSTYLTSILFFSSFLVVLVKIYICINIRGLPRTIECICRKFDGEKNWGTRYEKRVHEGSRVQLEVELFGNEVHCLES